MTLLTIYRKDSASSTSSSSSSYYYSSPPVCSLLLRDNGRKFDDLTPVDSDRPLFRIRHSSNPFCSKPNVAIVDTSNNSIVATVMLHIFTSKASITLSTPNVSSSFTYKKKFHSSVPGVGNLAWDMIGRDSDFNMELTNDKGEVIATYSGNRDMKGAEKRLDIWKNDLPPAAMDEIIVTLVARIERMRREMEVRFVEVPVNVQVSSTVSLPGRMLCV